jgi:regulatory protein
MSTRKTVLEKIYSYCAYQERTQQEVRNKLWENDIKYDQAEEIIVLLINENFINEERFALSYAGGKFRIKKWGRQKIKEGLKQKGISSYCLKLALKSIDEEEYLQTLQEIIEKRSFIEKEINTYIKNHKIARYAISKGFEPELVWSILKVDN